MNGRCDCEMRMAMPATQEAVETFFAEFRRTAQAHLAEPHSFAAELLVREALNNAVIHGCKCDAARQVLCRIRLRDRRLTILVADGGEGFNWRAAWGRIPGPSEYSGRGIEILRRYSTRVRYNDRGNAVTIFKTVLVRD